VNIEGYDVSEKKNNAELPTDAEKDDMTRGNLVVVVVVEVAGEADEEEHIEEEHSEKTNIRQRRIHKGSRVPQFLWSRARFENERLIG